MFIKRECIDKIGLFDYRNLPRGMARKPIFVTERPQLVGLMLSWAMSLLTGWVWSYVSLTPSKIIGAVPGRKPEGGGVLACGYNTDYSLVEMLQFAPGREENSGSRTCSDPIS
jgi:hypothetical protein